MTERRPSPLRFLAPVALVAFGLALYLIISSSPLVGPETGSRATGGGATEQRAATGTAAEERSRARRRRGKDRLPRKVYTVKPGDTLDEIAQRTGVGADRLQELNPKLDPQALGPGQKIRLRR
jgi:Tfp pilus assembly protein FimV